MSLGVGAIEPLQRLLGEFVVVFALVTQLGDVWFYFAVLGSWYWLGDRLPVLGPGLDRHGVARVVGIAVGALALALGAKALAGTARPPGAAVPPALDVVPSALRDVYAEAATADGHGFPSGHALGTTVVWGAVAWLYEGGTRRRRLALAAVVVAVVSLSRVALGVHYPVSVVGGVLVGAAFLAAVLRIEGVRATYGLAVALAVPAAALDGFSVDALLLLGLALGGLGTWTALGSSVPRTPTTAREGVLTAVLGAVVGGGLFGAGLAVVEAAWLAVLVGAAVGVAVLALPVVVGRVERKASVGG